MAENLGELLREYREKEGYRLVEAAEAMGMSKQQLHNYEKGHSYIGLEKLETVAKTLHAPLAVLIECYMNERLSRANLAEFQVKVSR